MSMRFFNYRLVFNKFRRLEVGQKFDVYFEDIKLNIVTIEKF